MEHKAREHNWLFLLLKGMIVIGAILQFFPLYWMVTSSFKVSHVVTRTPPQWVPLQPTLVNYQNLFSNANAGGWLLNSIFLAGATTVVIVVVSAMAAYAFAKLRFWGRGFLFTVLVCTLMLPKEIYIVPLFKVTQYLGIMGTFLGVILPSAAVAFGVFMLKNFFATVPDSLREAAKIDGAREARIFLQVYLPLARAGVAALVVLMFVQVWNDYLWQMIQLNKDSMKTLQLGIATLQHDQNPDYGLRMAGATLAALPLVVLFIAFQKHFTRGITAGAIKE